MNATVRAVLIAAWILAVGLLAVQLEVRNLRRGVRIGELMMERDARLERVRRLEMRYNRMVSPDLLEGELPADFRAGAEENDKSPPRSRA